MSIVMNYFTCMHMLFVFIFIYLHMWLSANFSVICTVSTTVLDLLRQKYVRSSLSFYFLLLYHLILRAPDAGCQKYSWNFSVLTIEIYCHKRHDMRQLNEVQQENLLEWKRRRIILKL